MLTWGYKEYQRVEENGICGLCEMIQWNAKLTTNICQKFWMQCVVVDWKIILQLTW